MTQHASTRKVKRSFTLSPESAAFVRDMRKRHKAASDSEALELLLKEKRLSEKLAEIDAAVKEYYDNASDKELREQSEWAEMTGPNMFADVPE